MRIRLIAIDIDGTILDGQARLCERNRDAVVRAVSRGVEVALATGRSYVHALSIARQIPCPLTMIVSNGAVVKSADGRTQLGYRLKCDVARQTLAAASMYREMAAVCFDRSVGPQVIFEKIAWDDPLRGPYFAANREFIAAVNPLADCLTEEPIQLMFAGRAAQVRSVEALLGALPWASEYALNTSIHDRLDGGLVDVLPAGCSKGASLARWTHSRGWSRDEVMAIGDNTNDLDMLEFAGMPVVMGNSVPELKQRGWRETLSNDQSGVAAAIAQYALEER